MFASLFDRISARLDDALHRFAGTRDESRYIWIREQMAQHPDWKLTDAFMERQLELIDQKITGLLIHSSLMIAVAAMIMTRVGFLIGLPTMLVACVFVIVAAMLLRCSRLFGAHDFRAEEELSPDLILARMAAQIDLRKNVYRRALRIIAGCTLLIVPIFVFGFLGTIVRGAV